MRTCLGVACGALVVLGGCSGGRPTASSTTVAATAAGPPVVIPSTNSPSTIELSTTSPWTTEPSTTELSTTEPWTTEPWTTELSTTEPSTTSPWTTAASTPATSGPAGSTDATSTRAEPRRPRTVSMAFTGDTLAHSPLWRRAAENAAASGRGDHDFRPMLAGLAPLLATVDLAVCHLETPIAPEGEALSTSPYYGVPDGIADAIATAGFDRCSTASNHALDRGTPGIDRTVDALESAGVGQSGMARNPDEIEPAVVEVAGVGVAHLSYTWSYNGLDPPPDEPWRSALIDPDRIVADALAARASGADVVVVSLHWGEEGRHEPTTFQRRIAQHLTATGAIDLIVGHHAHVVQPIERLNGRWVVYGLGNILSNLPTSARWPDATQDAMVAVVSATVHADGVVEIDRPVVHPTWVDHDAGWEVRVVADELARPDLGAGPRSRLERSLARTAAVVGEFLSPAARLAAAGRLDDAGADR